MSKHHGLPPWLRPWANETDLEKIESAVGEAELRTSVEIIPMIVHSSSPTGHVPYGIFMIYLLLLWGAIPFVQGLWPGLSWLVLEIVVVIAAVLLTWWQKDWESWCRWLTPARDQELSVWRRAQLEFYQSNIKATEGRTGVLIFVSIREHRAVVLADRAVSERLPAEIWQKVVANLIAGIKADDFGGGMITAINEVADLVELPFPRAASDINELPDKLLIRE